MTREEIMKLGAEGIEQRVAQIATEMNAENADINALTAEMDALEERKAQIKDDAEKRAKLAARVAAGELGGEARSLSGLGTATAMQANGPESKEYRDAWLKNIAVRSDGTRVFGEMTDVERRAFTHTTANTGAVVPTEIKNEIIELVESEAPMLMDAEKSALTRGFGVPRHKEIAAGDAKGVSEGTANEDEEDSFELLNLDGVEIKKHIVITRKMQFQSIDAFKTWLVRHLADRIMVAKERNIIARLDGIAPEGGSAQENSGIDAQNILTGKSKTDATILEVMALLKGTGTRVVYANNKTIWNVLGKIVGEDKKKLFIPDSMGDPITQGRIYGALVRKDDNIPDNVAYFGTKGQILANEFEDMFIYSAIEPKTANNVTTAYSLFDSGLKNPKAFAKVTFAD